METDTDRFQLIDMSPQTSKGEKEMKYGRVKATVLVLLIFGIIMTVRLFIANNLSMLIREEYIDEKNNHFYSYTQRTFPNVWNGAV
mgnify:CR=1 FL=1